MKKLTKQSRIVLSELPPYQHGVLNASLAEDIYSQSKNPARALHFLTALLIKDGWTNVQIINPIYHGKNGQLTGQNFRDIYSSDALLFSTITRTAPQTMQLVKKYHEINPGGIAIGGGPDPTFRKEKYLVDGMADIIFRGEADRNLVTLMERLTLSPDDLSGIGGISYRSGSSIIDNEPEPLLSVEELGRVPHPFYDSETRRGVRTAPLETTRGCPNDCEFCSVTKFYGKKFRVKPIQWTLDELKNIDKMGRWIFYSSDNLTGNNHLPESRKTALEMLEAIAKSKYKRKGIAQVTIDVAEYPELVSALGKAGIDFLCIGIESINPAALREMRKPYTAAQNIRNVKLLREAGRWNHGMMIIGFDADTPEIAEATTEYAKESLDSWQPFAPTPNPGTDMYARLEREGRIITHDFSLYDGQHVVIRPKNFTPYALQKTIFDGMEDFYSKKEIARRFVKSKHKLNALGIGAYIHLFGGKRRMLYNPQTRAHLEFLRSVS